MQLYNNHRKSSLHRFDAHVCPICGHNLHVGPSTPNNSVPSAAKTLSLVFLAVIMQISWIVFVFMMLFAPLAQAIPSLPSPACCICTSEGHKSMLIITRDGKCPAPIHTQTCCDEDCTKNVTDKIPPTICDILNDK